MKTFMKFLFAAFVAFTALSASATCYRTSNLPPGSPPAVLTNGLWCTEGEGRNNNNYGNTVVPVVIPAGYPGAGGGLSKCQTIGALGGAAVASTATNYTIQATVLGAIFGGMIGDAICQDDRGQRVMIQGQGRSQTGGELYQDGSTQRRNTVTVPSSCNIDGVGPVSGISDEDCKKIASRMTVKVDQVTTVTTKKVPSCLINTGQKEYRFNKVNGQMIDKPQCLRYLNKLDPLPNESEMALVQ